MNTRRAEEALRRLLWELPAEFGEDPEGSHIRDQFSVIKKNNVRKVHGALWELQQFFGMVEDE